MKTILTRIGRETFLAPVEWVDGWPVINGGEKFGLTSHGSGLYQIEAAVTWRDEFAGPRMALGWYRKSEWATKRRDEQW